MRCPCKNLAGVLLLSLFAGTGVYSTLLIAGPVDEAVDERVDVQREAEQTQQQVDELADETETMVDEYREVLRKIESRRDYNKQLRQQVERQDERLASFERQLDEIEETQRNIVPLMSRMLEVLDEMLAVDTPFLEAERQNRLAALQEMMHRSDVTLPDKFRRIMEAYQIEMDYGRNIEAYEGQLERDDGSRLTVEFLRVGRLGLYYQTLDGEQSGYWNPETSRWQTLSADYNRSIAKGLKIAQKQAAPDFFTIPVPAPEQAQ